MPVCFSARTVITPYRSPVYSNASGNPRPLTCSCDPIKPEVDKPV
jgi:hypothetical protein